MTSRRRDPLKRSSAYSSADFYRTLTNPTTSPSSGANTSSGPSSTGHGREDSEDDVGAMLMKTAVAEAPPTPEESDQAAVSSSQRDEEITAAQEEQPSVPSPRARGASINQAGRPISSGDDSDAPLSPPRPFFLGGSKRGSSSATSDTRSWSSASLDHASDSDGTPESSEQGAASNAAVPRRAIGRERSSTTPNAAINARIIPASQVRPRSHHRRRSIQDDGYAALGSNPFDTPPSSIYVPTPGVVSPSIAAFAAGDRSSVASRPPPSAFLPFQSHPGNPDPGMPIPGVTRRASLESFGRAGGRPFSTGSIYGTAGYSDLRSGSDVGHGLEASTSQVDFERPNAPFMDPSRDGAATPGSLNGSQNNIYRNSAAGAMSNSSAALAGNEPAVLPRISSAPQIAMRAAFLSPASRPTSIWSPPSYPYPSSLNSPPSMPFLLSGSGTPPPTSYLYVPKPTKTKTLMASTRLSEKLTKEDKPWLAEKPTFRVRISYWLTLLCFFLGIAAGAVVCFFGWTNVKMLKDSDLCMVLNEDFGSGSLDSNTWNMDVEMGGFGNGEFQMTTDDPANLHVTNGQLYLTPTLTSDEIGTASVLDGYTYKLKDCSVQGNSSACQATSSKLRSLAIPPVKAARVNTKGKVTIQFGKVEVKAKLPRGDWLWPAIWMLPEDDSVYGIWPMGGEMDIMEARGNGPEYPAQGVDFVRSSLNYGVFDTLQTHIFGWWSSKRSPYDQGFHTYSLEWTADWMRFYVDSRLQATINMKMTGRGGHSFFDRGHYPLTAFNDNGTNVVVQNIWASGSNAAPFDQSFYLILDLAAGGTSGWFPDGVGGKPWFDKSASAMYDFANNQSTWHATWPSSEDDLAFRVDSVKMWKLGSC